MTTTPTPGAPALAAGFDTGAADDDAVTSVNTPTIVGMAAPGATVVLYDTDGSFLGQAAADAVTGAYSIAIAGMVDANHIPINLDDGVHDLTVTADLPGMAPSAPSQPLKLPIDTQPPDAPTAPVLTPASDTGASALDGITAATALSLTGQSEPGATVRVFDGSAVVGQAVAAADGRYTITTGTLTPGAHSFTATATDLAGNTGAASGATAVTIDTAAPAAPPAPRLAPGSDTGVSRSDGVTHDTAPTVTGTAEAGSTVVLYDTDGTVLGKAAVQADGSYHIASGTVLAGPHTLTVVATDAAGNASPASAPLDIVVDDVPGMAEATVALATASAPSITFTLHFDQPIADRRGISPDDFTLVTTGTAYGDITGVTGSGSTGTVTVTGLGGSGTVALAFAKDSEITDLAGNPVALTSTQSHDVEGVPGGDVAPVSAGPTGVVGSGQDPSASANGRYVAFDSSFNNAAGLTSVYVKDMTTEGLTKISVAADGSAANGNSFDPSLSASGGAIAFDSDAANLVPGAPASTNVYVTSLTPANPNSSDSVEVGATALVSAGNGTSGSDPDVAPVISGDGTMVAFSSRAALAPGVTGGFDNVYLYDVATGALTLVTASTEANEWAYVPTPNGTFNPTLEPVSAPPGGIGGDFDSTVTGISADGSEIAFQSEATDLGAPNLNAADTAYSNAPTMRSYVYDTKTGKLTVLDGAGVFGETNAPHVYQTIDPVLSADGTKVVYSVVYRTNTSAVFEEDLATGAVTQLTPGPVANGVGDFDTGASLSKNGSYVAYLRSERDYATGGQFIEDDEIIGTAAAQPVTTEAGYTGDTGYAGTQAQLTPNGNAIVFTAPYGDGTEVLEDTLGLTAGIDPVGTDDEVGAAERASIASAGTLTVTGHTDAPAGATVQVQLGPSPGTPGPVLTGTVAADGTWSVAVPSGELGADGAYIVAATVLGATAESPRVIRAFTLDTASPATPDAPALDPSSNTGIAHDGTASDTDTPTLTGTAEAGSTVTLIDEGGLTPGLVLGTGIADAHGVYAIASTDLTQGQHLLAVTATDGAGNVSGVSATLALTIDSIVPDAPQAPAMVAATSTNPQTGAVTVSNGSVANPSGAGLITAANTPVLSGVALPGTTVTLYDSDGVAVLGTAVADAKGGWSITSSALSDGTHMLTVTQTKAAGGVSAASAPLDLTVDTLPPLSPVITSVGGPLTVNAEHTSQVDVNGTAEPGSTVTLHVDNDTLVSGTATVDAEGDYTIGGLVAPGTHKLTVIATDAAGNASQPSTVTDVTVDQPTAPSLVTPAGNPIQGNAQDGYLAGATVFADLNGNDLADPGEPVGVTGLDGSFALFGASGATLVASGGTDISTGLAQPGPLKAPAPDGGTVVISPLTTFLAAVMQATGDTLAAATTRADALLGLDPLDIIETLDVAGMYAPAPDGDVAGEVAPDIATAKLADTAAVLSAVIAAADPSATRAAAYAAVFAAMARTADTAGSLDVSTAAGVATILAQAMQALDPAFTLQGVTAQAAAQVVAGGNAALDALGQAANTTTDGETNLVSDTTAIERVEQGAAVSALAAATPAGLNGVVAAYIGAPLQSAIAAAEAAEVLSAPRLAASSDTGFSSTDEVTRGSGLVFTGTALPGAVVLIETVDTYGTSASSNFNQVVGIGTADASGHYSIATVQFSRTYAPGFNPSQTSYDGDYQVVAALATPGSTLAVGGLAGSTTLTPSVPFTEVVVASAQPAEDVNKPEIETASPTVAPGNDATDAALQLVIETGNGSPVDDDPGTLAVYADGGTVPIATGTYAHSTQDVALTTTPLSAGVHSLTLVQTLASGTAWASDPYTVTVTVPGVLQGAASAAGPLSGGTVFIHTAAEQVASGAYTTFDISQSFGPTSPGAVAGQGYEDVAAATDATGAFTLPAPGATDTVGIDDAWQPLLGIALDGSAPSLTYRFDRGTAALFAPAGVTEITPLSSLVADTVQEDAENGRTLTVAEAESEVLAALGEAAGQDVLSADPLALAESGDSTLLRLDIQLLDTVDLLTPIDGFSFGQLADDLANYKSLDLDDPQSILAMMQKEQPYALKIPAGLQSALAAIIAASNAGIDAYAATATGPADLISHTLAAAFVAQNGAAGAFATAVDQIKAALVAQYNQPSAPSPAPAIMAPLVAAYTGSGLDTAVADALGQMVQVTGFAPVAAGDTTMVDGAYVTDAPTVTVRVTFSRAVSGIRAGEFSVNGIGVSDASVMGVSAVPGSGGTQYDVTVGTGIGGGQLSLTYNGTGVTGSNGAPLVTGGFDQPVFLATGLGVPDAIAVGDLNGDGLPDIVAAGVSGYTETFTGNAATVYDVQVFINNGNGAFVPATLGITLPNSVTGLALGDVTGDGTLDIVAVSAAFDEDDDATFGIYGTLTILPGNGDGTFGAPIHLDPGASATRLALGDFNDDGRTDIVTNGGTPGTLTLLLNNGDGTFRSTTAALPASIIPSNVAVADLTGNGQADIIASDEIDGTIEILMGRGDGTFQPGETVAIGGHEAIGPYGTVNQLQDIPVDESDNIAVGDLTGSGVQDIVTVNATDRTVVLLRGDGQGGFTPQTVYTFPAGPVSPSLGFGVAIDAGDSFLQAFTPASVVIADMNDDGIPDLLIGNGQASTVELLGNGDGTFRVGPETANGTSYDEDSGGGPGFYSRAGTAVAADLNGDGRTDILTGGDQQSAANSQYGLDVLQAAAPDVLAATSTPVTVHRAGVAQPEFAQTSGPGTLTASGNAYTLDLGQIAQGSLASLLQLSLSNLRFEMPTDAFTGTFFVPASQCFAVSGASLPGPLSPGQSYDGLSVAIDTGTLGSHSQTIIFAPLDQTDQTTTYGTDGASSDSVTASTATAGGVNGSAELAPLVLTITDQVVAAADAAAIGPVAPVALPDVRMGQADTQPLTIANTAAPGAPSLSVSATASGAATISGGITGLVAGSTDGSGLIAGLATGSAGAQSGTVTLSPVSIAADGTSTALAPVTVPVSGAVYRPAAAVVAPVSIVQRVGDTGPFNIAVSNADPADGYSEALVATVAGTSGAVTAGAAASTGDIAAGASSQALTFTAASGSAGTAAGTVTLALSSDGTGIDGLGTLALDPATITVTVTTLNHAAPMLFDSVDGGTQATVTGADATIDLGDITLGSSPITVALGIANAATGPADLLAGSFTQAAVAGFANDLAAVAGVAAGGSANAGTVTFTPTALGVGSETITFAPSGSDASGTEALAPQTITITGTVVPGTSAPEPAVLSVPSILTLPNARAGTADTAVLPVSNAGPAGAGALDVTAQATGHTSVTGSVSALAAGSTDSSDLAVSLATADPGGETGEVVLTPVSEASGLATPLPLATVQVAGKVYREAAASILPVSSILHVGDPGTIDLRVTNTARQDGYSEALSAALLQTQGGLGPGAVSSISLLPAASGALELTVPTDQAGTVAGTVTVGLASDGGTGEDSTDGLGSTPLAPQAVPVSVTVDRYAATSLSSSGDGRLTQTGAASFTLDLGTVQQNAAALSADLQVGNAAVGPADWLNGSFSVSGGSGFTNGGLGGFTGLGAGTSVDAGTVSLSTAQAGTFSETLVLSPAGSNAAGYSAALAAQTITVTGTVLPAGSANGDVHMQTFDGLRYDFQAVGDYVLARSAVAGDSFQVQIRTVAAPANGAVSVTAEVAAQVGSDIVTIAAGRPSLVEVDGVADTTLGTTTPAQALTGGSVARLSATTYLISWATGQSLTVTDQGSYLDSSVALGPQGVPGSVQGLLGSDEGAAHDFQLPDGTALPAAAYDSEILGTFAPAWSVAPGTSILDSPAAGLTFLPSGNGAAQEIAVATPGQVTTADGGSLVYSDPDHLGGLLRGTLADLSQALLGQVGAQDMLDVTDLDSQVLQVRYAASGAGGLLQMSDATQTGAIRLLTPLTGTTLHVTQDHQGGSLIALG